MQLIQPEGYRSIVSDRLLTAAFVLQTILCLQVIEVVSCRERKSIVHDFADAPDIDFGRQIIVKPVNRWCPISTILAMCSFLLIGVCDLLVIISFKCRHRKIQHTGAK